MNNKNLCKRDLIQIYLNNGFTTQEASAEIDFAIEILCSISPKDLIMGIMPDPSDIQKLYSIINKRV